MKYKLILFIIILVIAGVMVILGADTKTIVCSNNNHTCYNLTENSILKNSRKGMIYDIRNNSKNTEDEASVEIIPAHLVCRAHHVSIQKNSETRTKTRYYLIPYSNRHHHKISTRKRALNTYASRSVCEIDREALESYLNSDETEDFVYKTAGSNLNFLFYIGAAGLVLLGLYILILGKSDTLQKAENYNDLTPEQKNELYEKAMTVTDKLKVFDSITDGRISQVEDELKKLDNNNDKQ